LVRKKRGGKGPIGRTVLWFENSRSPNPMPEFVKKNSAEERGNKKPKFGGGGGNPLEDLKSEKKNRVKQCSTRV